MSKLKAKRKIKSKYKDMIVCFVDVLGFAERVKKTLDEKGNEVSEKTDAIIQAYNCIRNNSGHVREFPIHPSVNVTLFSDSIVISFETNVRSGIFYSLLHLLHTQLELMKFGFIVRGAIAHGKMLHNKNMLFGPALVDAYQWENKAALYPRIILSEEIIHVAEKYHSLDGSPEHEREHIMKLISRDTDGLYYIDYIAKADGELDDPTYDSPTYFNQIYKVISGWLLHTTPAVRIKYLWMQEKYNAAVQNIRKNLKTRKWSEDIRELYEEIELIP